jgi:hypothetical protein
MQFPAGTRFTPYTVLRNVCNQPITVTPRCIGCRLERRARRSFPQSRLVPRSSLTWTCLPRSKVPAWATSTARSTSFWMCRGHGTHCSLPPEALIGTTRTCSLSAPAAVLESFSKSLSYWSTANGDDTMVTLWNAAVEAQDFRFTLFFTGGQYTLPLHLEGKLTRSFNISGLISSQIPDAQGHTALRSKVPS